MKRSDNKKRFMNRMHSGDIRHLKRYLWLLAPLFMLLASLLLIRQTRTREPKSHYDVMTDAAERADAAFQAIREERLLRGHAISPIDDPNRTGLVGDSYTEITTTLGSLPSKRSAANPNIAAMIVDMLTQCGVKAGDPVAVNFSGSFPGLNASVLCALDAMGAKGIVISSVGASTYGANLPDFTWLDMEEALLYLSKTGAMRLEGGFLVLYNGMEVKRLILDNKIRYKQEDYKTLNEYYKQKIQQIHIVGEYANLMVKDYSAALQFVQDYFQMDFKKFIAKYFKGERAAEISRNITPERYSQLFGGMSETQSQIIQDAASKYIVAAAGPGSGKTRVLVHKLASLLTLEESSMSSC